jgi:hypothetical protein
MDTSTCTSLCAFLLDTLSCLGMRGPRCDMERFDTKRGICWGFGVLLDYHTTDCWAVVCCLLYLGDLRLRHWDRDTRVLKALHFFILIKLREYCLIFSRSTLCVHCCWRGRMLYSSPYLVVFPWRCAVFWFWAGPLHLSVLACLLACLLFIIVFCGLEFLTIYPSRKITCYDHNGDGWVC